MFLIIQNVGSLLRRKILLHIAFPVKPAYLIAEVTVVLLRFVVFLKDILPHVFGLALHLAPISPELPSSFLLSPLLRYLCSYCSLTVLRKYNKSKAVCCQSSLDSFKCPSCSVTLFLQDTVHRWEVFTVSTVHCALLTKSGPVLWHTQTFAKQCMPMCQWMNICI